MTARFKRWLTSRPVLVALVVTALVMAFAAGRVFADERDTPRAARGRTLAADGRSRARVAHLSTRGVSVVPVAKHVASHRSGLRGGEALQRRTLAPDSVTCPGRRERTPGLLNRSKSAGSSAGSAEVNARFGTPDVERRDGRERPASPQRPCPSTFGDDGLPPLPREEFEECRKQAIAQLQRDAATLKLLAALALIFTSIIALRWVRRYEAEPEDLGEVTPRPEWK